jgi:hypothetical protein
LQTDVHILTPGLLVRYCLVPLVSLAVRGASHTGATDDNVTVRWQGGVGIVSPKKGVIEYSPDRLFGALGIETYSVWLASIL